MRVGERLPGVRELAAEHHASAATISSALVQLTALGLVIAEPGRGTFVASRPTPGKADFSWQSQALGRSRVDAARAKRVGVQGRDSDIRFSWGYPSTDLLPLSDLERLALRVARDEHAWIPTPVAGHPELRQVIGAEYRASAEEVLITSGGQPGLVHAMRTLAAPGSTILIESPSYFGAILAAEAAGLSLVPVAADEHGILPEALATALTHTGARVVYLQPNHANPTGAVLPAERRKRVLELAQEHGAFIIEDDWARHLGIDAATPTPLIADAPHGHVVTVATLSKPTSPALRLGAVIARGPAAERLRTSRAADDLGVSPTVQEIALGLLTSSAWPKHLRRLRDQLRERRDTMIDALAAALPEARATTPGGGLHLWVELPPGVDSTELASAAAAAGVLVADGRHFFSDEAPAQFLRLSYGAVTPDHIAGGIARLAGLARA